MLNKGYTDIGYATPVLFCQALCSVKFMTCFFISCNFSAPGH